MSITTLKTGTATINGITVTTNIIRIDGENTFKAVFDVEFNGKKDSGVCYLPLDQAFIAMAFTVPGRYFWFSFGQPKNVEISDFIRCVRESVDQARGIMALIESNSIPDKPYTYRARDIVDHLDGDITNNRLDNLKQYIRT